MPFLAERHEHIPTRDLVSWIFEGLYDEDKPIYIDALHPSRSISKSQARLLIRQLVAGFRRQGLQEGEVVCIVSANDIYYPIIFLGVIAAGGVISAANPNYQHLELVHHLKAAKVKIVIAQASLLDKATKAASECGIQYSDVLVYDRPDDNATHGSRSWTRLLEQGERDWVRFDSKQRSEDTTAALLFSSGTTGLPKPVMLTHRNFIAQHVLVFESQKLPFELKRLIALPMFHAAMAPAAHTSALRGGYQTYVLPGYDVEKYLWSVEKYQLTDLVIVPPVAISIINSPLRNKYSLKSVRRMLIGAAPLREGPQARMQALLNPDAPFTQVFGMTETCCLSFMFQYPEGDITASVGRPLPGLDVKLVDEEGKDITGYSVRGELCVRGPLVCKGYLNSAEGNRSFDEEGYFHTGDIAECEESSRKWYIVDRKKELIKVRGFQVAPPELEGVLLSHPDIVDAAVIGVEMNDSEYPRAYIVRRAGASLTEQGVRQYMAERLIYYKRLDGGVIFCDAIPRNPSGKILKRVLREQARHEMGARL